MAESPSESLERRIECLESGDGGERRRTLVIVNPYATTVSERLRNLVAHALSARYQVDVIETQAPGHATEICRQAAIDGYELAVAFGGDGTVNEAANGLVGSNTALTCLPGGSANVYCKLLGIPAEIVDATEHLLSLGDNFTPRLVDVGVVEGRHYTFSAGVGMDASVVRRVDAHPRRKSRYGANYFLWTALSTFARSYLVRPPRLFVAVNGQTIAGVTAIVQNAEHYTYFHDRPIDLAQGATLDSGTLAGVVLRRGSLLDVPSLLARAAAGRGLIVRHRQVEAFEGAADLTVSSANGHPLPLQVDGDYVGDVTEAHFTIRPRALTVVS